MDRVLRKLIAGAPTCSHEKALACSPENPGYIIGRLVIIAPGGMIKGYLGE